MVSYSNLHGNGTKIRSNVYGHYFDEQLFSKAKLLQWHRPFKCDIMLGGFYTQMSFAKVMCHFMEDTYLAGV